jgi:hypothetical protein
MYKMWRTLRTRRRRRCEKIQLKVRQGNTERREWGKRRENVVVVEIAAEVASVVV